MSEGQNRPSFIEAARRAQIIEYAIQTIALVGYGQASLAQIAQRAGMSKGVISYYFNSKEELLDQVLNEVYTAGAKFMVPQIVTQPSPTLQLQTYIRTNVEYIGAHRMEMIAVSEILLNSRTKDGKLRFDAPTEEPILVPLEAILRQGQENGEFRTFHLRVMAVTIRRAIDAVAAQLVAHENLDVDTYARELVALFDRATRLG